MHATLLHPAKMQNYSVITIFFIYFYRIYIDFCTFFAILKAA